MGKIYNHKIKRKKFQWGLTIWLHHAENWDAGVVWFWCSFSELEDIYIYIYINILQLAYIQKNKIYIYVYFLICKNIFPHAGFLLCKIFTKILELVVFSAIPNLIHFLTVVPFFFLTCDISLWFCIFFSFICF